MPDLRFDHLHTYAELTDALEQLAAAAPELMTLEVAGTSHEGRSIWLATVTNTATGPHDEKPAIFVEANIHATEITASTAALHLLHHLTTGYGTDPAVTRALDTRTFYVIPRVNPDGVELALRAEDPVYLRSSTRIYPRPERRPGLVERDVDGDGRILCMRVEDPDGAWAVHPDDPRLLVAAPVRRRRPRTVLPAAARGRRPRARRRPRAARAASSRASTSTATSRRTGSPRAPSTARVRSRRPSPRCARSWRRWSRGRTSASTSPTTPTPA